MYYSYLYDQKWGSILRASERKWANKILVDLASSSRLMIIQQLGGSPTLQSAVKHIYRHSS